MNGLELVEMCKEADGLAARVSGAYLAGFIHGHIAADSRISEDKRELSIPNDLDVNRLKEIVIMSQQENPEWLELDVGTFFYAIFQKHFSNVAQ
jgi:hypothetical protein